MSGRKPSPATDIPPVTAQHAPIGEASAVAKQLAADIEQALSRGETELLSEDAIQALMAAACRSYAARIKPGQPSASPATQPRHLDRRDGDGKRPFEIRQSRGVRAWHVAKLDRPLSRTR